MEGGVLCVTIGMSGPMRMQQLSVVSSTYPHPVSDLDGSGSYEFYILKCKKHFIKMLEDVGMVVPKIKETRL